MNALSHLESLYLVTLGDLVGLDCELEAPGFLVVHVHGRQCFVLLDPADPGFLRLGTTEAWPEGTVQSAAADAVARVNRRCPGIKATLTHDHEVAVFAAEMMVAPDGCLPTGPHIATVMHRMLGALLDAVRVFGEDLVLSHLAHDPVG